MAGLLETRVRATSAKTRRSKAMYDDDRETRDKAICEADQNNVPMREIARWTGDEAAGIPALSDSQVQRIVYLGAANAAEQMEKAIP